MSHSEGIELFHSWKLWIANGRKRKRAGNASIDSLIHDDKASTFEGFRGGSATTRFIDKLC